MGRITKGILGGFSGTVGTVVGGNWKGIDYMRSRSVSRSSRVSLAQQVHRAKFSIATKFLRAIKDLLAISFRDFANSMTGQNSALSYTLKNAVQGVYPDLRIDYSQALVARGNLPNAFSPAVASSTPGVVSFTWKDNSGIGIAKPGDKAVLVVYSESLNHCAYTIAGATRSVGADTLAVAAFSGKEVQTWLAFIGENGREISSSVFTGKITVA